MKLNLFHRLRSLRGSSVVGLLRSGVALGVLAIASLASADIIVPGADGSDGDLILAYETRVIDLALATTGTWNQPGNGNGVYDPAKWAVVFKYRRVRYEQSNIQFKPHPSGAPVVWLVSEFVSSDPSLRGAIILNGTTTSPGPGGFRSGGFDVASYGFGPGAGGTTGTKSFASHGVAGSNGGPIYGNERIMPLVGGSGGGGKADGPGGGGGAILIACQGIVEGLIVADSNDTNGEGTGSGGAIRIVADRIGGFLNLRASLRGRIRVETNAGGGPLTANAGGGTVSTSTDPFTTAQIWPTDTHPKVGIVQVHGISAPTDPRARLEEATTDLAINAGSPVVVRMEALNVPSTWKVEVKVVPKTGRPIIAEATKVEGNDLASFWQANVQFPAGASVIQARAYKP